MATRAEPAERRVNDWPLRKRRTGAKALDRAGLGKVAWVLCAVLLVLAVVVWVRPVNWGVQWGMAWIADHAAALADSLSHRRHRSGGYPRAFHGPLIVGNGAPVVLAILVLMLVLLRRSRPQVGRAAGIAGAALLVAAVLMVVAFALGWAAADVTILRAIGSGAHFVGGLVADMEMTK